MKIFRTLSKLLFASLLYLPLVQANAIEQLVDAIQTTPVTVMTQMEISVFNMIISTILTFRVIIFVITNGCYFI